MIDVASARASARPLAARLAGWRRSLGVVTSPFRIREEASADVAAREGLLDQSFGAARFGKTCERLRENRHAAEGLSFAAVAGDVLVGTLRFWHVEAGDREALMLGPLAVAPAMRSLGLGRALIEHGLGRARRLGHGSVVLVGDAPYYARFGFDRALTTGLVLPGPVEESRFLGLELVPGALAGAEGRVVGSGVLQGAKLQGEYRRAA